MYPLVATAIVGPRQRTAIRPGEPVVTMQDESLVVEILSRTFRLFRLPRIATALLHAVRAVTATAADLGWDAAPAPAAATGSGI